MGKQKGKDPIKEEDFWGRPENHFWKNGSYTEKAVKELDEWAKETVKSKFTKDIHQDLDK